MDWAGRNRGPTTTFILCLGLSFLLQSVRNSSWLARIFSTSSCNSSIEWLVEEGRAKLAAVRAELLSYVGVTCERFQRDEVTGKVMEGKVDR